MEPMSRALEGQTPDLTADKGREQEKLLLFKSMIRRLHQQARERTAVRLKFCRDERKERL